LKRSELAVREFPRVFALKAMQGIGFSCGVPLERRDAWPLGPAIAIVDPSTALDTEFGIASQRLDAENRRCPVPC
jgi:hypothetical protein